MSTLLITLLIAFQTDVIVFRMPFTTEDMIDDIAFQMLVSTFWIVVVIVCTVVSSVWSR